MKHTFVHAIGLPTLGALALTTTSIIAADAPLVISRGPHHRVWQTTRQVPTPDGKTRTETGSYVELQGGLHRWTEQGWVETSPRLEVFQDGAVARNLQYQAIFAPNLATPGAIDLLLPSGQRLQGHLIGLALSEGDRSVLIAEVKDCAGVIGGAEQNALTFPDAFTDFDISVQFVLQRDRISQNVIVHQQLPHPSEWGLTENAVLEVLTEWTTFPDVRLEAREALDGLAAHHVSFDSMEFVSGRAFSLGDEGNAVGVAKTWEVFQGPRSCLVEKIPWKALAPELAKLPPVAKNWKKRDGPLMARNQLRLPRREQARAAVKPIHVAPKDLPASVRQGVVIDNYPIGTDGSLPLPGYAAAVTVPVIDIKVTCVKRCPTTPVIWGRLFQWVLGSVEVTFGSEVTVRPSLPSYSMTVDVLKNESEHVLDMTNWANDSGKGLADSIEDDYKSSSWMTKSACERDIYNALRKALLDSLRQAYEDSIAKWDDPGHHNVRP